MIRFAALGERGQSTVEAAFALPIILACVLLLIQPGIILYDRMVMRAAAAEGVAFLRRRRREASKQARTT